jgi:hypothetical protein
MTTPATVTVTLYNKTGTGATVNDAIKDAYSRTTKTDKVRPGANYGFHPPDSIIAKWWQIDSTGVIRCTLTKDVVGNVGKSDQSPPLPTHAVLVKMPTRNVVVGPFSGPDTAATVKSRIAMETEVHPADVEVITLCNLDQLYEKLKEPIDEA